MELIKLINLKLDKIITDVESKEILETEKRLLLMDKPNVWNINTAGNMEVEMEVDFEKFLIAVAQHTNEDLNTMTVFRFHALLGYIKDKQPKKN